MTSNIIYNNIEDSIIKNDEVNLEYIEYNNASFPWKLNTTYLSHNNNNINIPEHNFFHTNYFLIESKTSDIKLKTINSKKIFLDSPCVFNENSIFKNIDASNLTLSNTIIADYMNINRIDVNDLWVSGVLNLNANRTNIRGDINLEGTISINGSTDIADNIGSSNTNIKFANINNSIIGQNGPDIGFFTNITCNNLTTGDSIIVKNIDCSENITVYEDLYVANSLILKSLKLENLYTYYNLWEYPELSFNYIFSPTRSIAIEDNSKNKISIKNYKYLLKKGKYIINTGILNTVSNDKVYKFYSHYVGFEVYDDLSYNFTYKGIYNRSDELIYTSDYPKNKRSNPNIEKFYRGEIEIDITGNFGYANIAVYHADFDHVDYNFEYDIKQLFIYEHDINVIEEFSNIENTFERYDKNIGKVIDSDNDTKIIAERTNELNEPLNNNQLDFYTSGIRRLQIDECGNILYGNIYRNPIQNEDYFIKIDFSNGNIFSKSDISCQSLYNNNIFTNDLCCNHILSNNINSNEINILSDISINNNLYINGNIYGPNNMIIDPSGHDNNTGTLTIKGNLIVEGTETIINSNIVDISDYRILLSSSFPDKNGAGIEVSNNKLFTYNSSLDSWNSNINLSCNNNLIINNKIDASSIEISNNAYFNTIFINQKKIISSENSERIDFTNISNTTNHGFSFFGDISINGNLSTTDSNNIISSNKANIESIQNSDITISDRILFKPLDIFSDTNSINHGAVNPTIMRDSSNLTIMNFNQFEIKDSHDISNNGLTIKTNIIMNDFHIKDISMIQCYKLNSGNISSAAINTNTFSITSGPISCMSIYTNNQSINSGNIICTQINTNHGNVFAGDISCLSLHSTNIISTDISCNKIDTNNHSIIAGDISCNTINTNNHSIIAGDISCNSLNTGNNDINTGNGNVICSNILLNNLSFNPTIDETNNTLNLFFDKTYAIKELNYDGIISSFNVNDTASLHGSQIIIKILPSLGNNLTIYGYENSELQTTINSESSDNIIINFAEDLELEGDGVSSILITAIKISNNICVSASIFKKKQ